MRDFSQRSSYSRRRKTSYSNMTVFFFIGVVLGLFILVYRWQHQSPTSSVADTDNQEQTSVRKMALPPLVVPKKTSEDVVRKIGLLTADKQGTYGWYVQSLKTGETYGSSYDFAYTAASVNKVPIMIEFLLQVEEGKMSLSDPYTLSRIDLEGGTGTLQYKRLGSVYTHQDLLTFIGQYSDNTAANAFARELGVPTIQTFINGQGMKHTDIMRNTTSPEDMAHLFSNVYQDKVFQNKDSKQLFFDALTDTDFEDRIPAGVPEGTIVAHKIGNQIQTLNDCGIVMGGNPYTLCILTNGINEAEAKTLLPQISSQVWNYEKNR